MARLYVQAQKFQIAGSGVSSSATSITLVSFKITKPDGSTRDITMADFGDLGLLVIDPGVARKEETISFTGVTQNGDGSATLTGVTRGITPFSPYGSDASYASAHSGFVTAILSNPAKMYSNFIGPTDNVTVTGLWAFPYPTSATSPATKQYVDDVLAGTIGTATDTTAGSTKVTKNQSTKPRAKSTFVREQNTPDMTLKVESFKLAFIDSLVTYAGGNSPSFINPGLGGDLAIVSNPSNTETVTLTINGTVCTFTFVTVIGATPGNILIQGTAALTRAALATFIANPGTTNANQVAFAGAQLTALGLVSSTDDLSANLFIRANSSTVTTFTGAETMAGGSNTWTANTTKNRIDLLVLNGGSLAIRKGSEAVTPTAPTPTTGDTVLCSVYNIPGETTIKDTTAALAGYIDQWYDLSVYRTDLATSASVSAVTKFGGTGTDGALNVTSGTTTIDLGSANFVTKNYTSINVSVGATLAFSNPASGGTVIQLKSQGAVTVAGTIDASGTGTAGGAAVSTVSTPGNPGQAVAPAILFVAGGMTGGLGGIVAGGIGGGTPATSPYFYMSSLASLSSGIGRTLIPGTGGGSGSVPGAGGTSGVGGRGGGALYIECAGAWNFTGTINVSGLIGGNGTGGGGGGGAGTFLALYNTLTASSGTVTNNSGGGGTGTSGSNCGGAGGGASALGTGGNGGFNAGAPAAPSNGGGGGGGGGFGGISPGASSTSSLLSLIAKNVYFA
jgi:hypothetical protein